MINAFSKNKLVPVASLIFLALSGWWLSLNVRGLAGESDQAELFSAVYGTMALFGGIVGLAVSKKWGGNKSLIGKSILMASLGLLAQEFGQVAYSLYTYLLHTEIPYPSVGDIGYFGSIIFYMFSAIYLIKALKLKTTLTSVKNQFWVIGVPLILLATSYLFFLNGYEFDFNNPLVIFLDFGYPLGQAIYISLAILAYLLSRNYLGGIMKPVIIFILFALVIQYASDFTFLYQVNRETWKTGGINDYMYLISYFVMTIALLRFDNVIQSLREGTSRASQEVQRDES